MIMTLDNYKLTLLTAVFIFIILPARGQIKFPSYKPAEQNFRAATQPEAQTQQFYSITSEEGQATIQIEKKQYNPTAVPNSLYKNDYNYSTSGLQLSTNKTIKSFGGGTGTVSSTGRRSTNQKLNTTNNTSLSYSSLTYRKNETETKENIIQQETQTIQDYTEEGMSRLPSEPGTNPDQMPIPSGISFLLICAALYAFIFKNKK